MWCSTRAAASAASPCHAAHRTACPSRRRISSALTPAGTMSSGRSGSSPISRSRNASWDTSSNALPHRPSSTWRRYAVSARRRARSRSPRKKAKPTPAQLPVSCITGSCSSAASDHASCRFGAVSTGPSAARCGIRRSRSARPRSRSSRGLGRAGRAPRRSRPSAARGHRGRRARAAARATPVRGGRRRPSSAASSTASSASPVERGAPSGVESSSTARLASTRTLRSGSFSGSSASAVSRAAITGASAGARRAPLPRVHSIEGDCARLGQRSTPFGLWQCACEIDRLSSRLGRAGGPDAQPCVEARDGELGEQVHLVFGRDRRAAAVSDRELPPPRLVDEASVLAGLDRSFDGGLPGLGCVRITEQLGRAIELPRDFRCGDRWSTVAEPCSAHRRGRVEMETADTAGPASASRASATSACAKRIRPRGCATTRRAASASARESLTVSPSVPIEFARSSTSNSRPSTAAIVRAVCDRSESPATRARTTSPTAVGSWSLTPQLVQNRAISLT